MPPEMDGGPEAVPAEGLGFESPDLQQSPTPAPTDQSADQPTAPTTPDEGDEPPWRREASAPPPWSAPPAPQYQQALPAEPWQPQVPQGMPPVDMSYLDTNVVAARGETLKAHYQGLYNAAPTEAERAAINAQYQAATLAHQVKAEQARLGYERWQMQQDLARSQEQLLPLLRQQAADALVARYNGLLSRDEVLKDPRGRDIWDPNVMALLAEERATHKWRANRQARGSADRPVAAAGGQAATIDIGKMSDAEFDAFRERNRRSGGRLLG